MGRITEVKTVKIDCACKTNPVYLRWQGTNGGYNYWLFHTVQSESENVEITGEFQPHISDLENAIGNDEILSKDSVTRVVIGAHVDASDLTEGFLPNSKPGLKGLLRSPNVVMLVNPTTWQTYGVKWIRVRVQGGSFKILDTNQTKNTIELTLLMPKIYIQQR